MLITIYHDAATFLEKARPFLEFYEAESNLILGISLRMLHSNSLQSDLPYFITVEDEEGLVVVGVMTPPQSLMLYGERADCKVAIDLIVEELYMRDAYVSGVVAPVQMAHTFARTWSIMAKQPYKLQRQERIYVLTEVEEPTCNAGQLVLATEADLDLVTRWMYAFQVDAGLRGWGPETENIARRKINSCDMYLWVDGQPVSMGGRTRPTINGVGLNAVYTPPEFRRRGYASTFVAQLSQHMLDMGQKFCVLFTDLANATANSIYQQIGYKPVCDVDEYHFSAT